MVVLGGWIQPQLPARGRDGLAGEHGRVSGAAGGGVVARRGASARRRPIRTAVERSAAHESGQVIAKTASRAEDSLRSPRGRHPRELPPRMGRHARRRREWRRPSR